MKCEVPFKCVQLKLKSCYENKRTESFHYSFIQNSTTPLSIWLPLSSHSKWYKYNRRRVEKFITASNLPARVHLRWASTSEVNLGGFLFFCWYLANEYHIPPAVLMINPVTFRACTCTPPSNTKPRVWEATTTKKKLLIFMHY